MGPVGLALRPSRCKVQGPLAFRRRDAWQEAALDILDHVAVALSA
jgi:hypothetical protein